MRRLKFLLPLCLLGGCGPKEQVAVLLPPRPTPPVVDTATPPQLRPTRELVLLGTTDVHNWLLPYDYYTGKEVGYGLARIKPLVDSIRKANPWRTYLFESGDVLQGNPLGYVFARLENDQPNPVIRAMNLMKYDASTIGNHEFNYGVPYLNNAISEARFPFVTANVTPGYKTSVMLRHTVAYGDTIMIGVTGNTPPGVALWDKGNVDGRLKFIDVVNAVKAEVQNMKAAGADIVVVLSHGGLQGSSYDTTNVPPENNSIRLAKEVPGIDVIFMGHTHQEVADTNVNGVLLTQARNWAQSLSVATLKLERRGASDWIAIDKHARILKPDSTRVDSAFVDSLKYAHERTLTYVKSVIGSSTERMESKEARFKDTPIIDFINEVQRKNAGTQLSAAAAFDDKAVIPKGPVTVADIAGLYVYANTLKAVRITGQQLRAYLEKSAEYFGSRNTPGYNYDMISGVEYIIDARKPIGSRITLLNYQGKPVTDAQTFTLALNNYRANGGGGYSMLQNAPVIYDKQQDIKDLLIDEVKARKVIKPEAYYKKNWELIQ